MSTLDLARLERIRAILPADDAEWLSERLEPKWVLRERRLTVRDGSIRLAAFMFCQGMLPKAAARHLAEILARYIATAWRHQQRLVSLPFEASIVHVFMHQICRWNDGKAIGHSQLLNILRGGRDR